MRSEYKLFTVLVFHVSCLSQPGHRAAKQAVIGKALKSCLHCTVTAVLHQQPNDLCQTHPLHVCFGGSPESLWVRGYLQTVKTEICAICERSQHHEAHWCILLRLAGEKPFLWSDLYCCGFNQSALSITGAVNCFNMETLKCTHIGGNIGMKLQL